MYNAQTDAALEAENYLNISIAGHHPLFFREWLYEMDQNTDQMNHFMAQKIFNSTFVKLSKHKNPDRKKMALCSLPENERKEFIKAWIKLAEVGTLKNNSELH